MKLAMTKDPKQLNQCDQLEDKAIDALKALTESVATTPTELLNVYAILRVQFKDNPEALK